MYPTLCHPMDCSTPGSSVHVILQARILERVQFSTVAQSCPTLKPHGLWHARLPCPSPTPGACSKSFPLSQWCHPTISSSVIHFCLQSFPASGSFPKSQLFSSGSQYTGASASASVLPMNVQDWSPLGWTGLISLQSKWLSRVFSNTAVQKHQFFGAQLSFFLSFFLFKWRVIALQNFVIFCQTSTWLSNSHTHTQLLENHSFDYTDLCWQSNVSAYWYAVYVCHSFSSKEQAS